MLLNILYYDQAAQAKASSDSGGLFMGPLLITPQQVCISLSVKSSYFSSN